MLLHPQTGPQRKGFPCIELNIFYTLVFLPKVLVWLKINVVKQIYAGVKSKAAWISWSLRNDFPHSQPTKRLKNEQGWSGIWSLAINNRNQYYSRNVFQKYCSRLPRFPPLPRLITWCRVWTESALQTRGINYSTELVVGESCPLTHQRTVPFPSIPHNMMADTFCLFDFTAKMHILCLKETEKPRLEFGQDNYEHKFCSQKKKEVVSGRNGFGMKTKILKDMHCSPSKSVP